jgi:hypothetical protein
VVGAGASWAWQDGGLLRDAENAETNSLYDFLTPVKYAAYLTGQGSKIRQDVPFAAAGKFLSAMGLGSLKLNGKSVLVKYDDDLPRERDSNLIRFPLSGNLIKKLCVLWELCER